MDQVMSNLGSQRCQYNERKIQDSEQRHHAQSRETGSSGDDDRSDTVGKPDVVAGRLQGTGGGHGPLVFPAASRPDHQGTNDQEMKKDNESIEVLKPTENKKNTESTASRSDMSRNDDLLDLSAWDVVTPTEANAALQAPLLPQKEQHTKSTSRTAAPSPGQGRYLGGSDTPLHQVNRQEQKMDTKPAAGYASRDVEDHTKHTANQTSFKPNGKYSCMPKKTDGPGSSQMRPSCPTHVESGPSWTNSSITGPGAAAPCRIEGCVRTGADEYKGFCLEHILDYLNRHPEQRKFFATCYGENSISSSFATSSPRQPDGACFRQSDDQRALYHDVHKRRHDVSRDISFGEGVPGQGYNETPLWSPTVVRGRPDLFQQPSPHYIPCRDRDCTQPGRLNLNGFCEPHARELRQSFAMPSKNNATDVPPRVQALRNSQLKLDISKRHDATEPMRKPSTSDIDCRHRSKCISEGCSRWGQSALQDLCSTCYNQTFGDETHVSHEGLLRDYESMVGNIVTVSKDATRKCRRPGCENFGNSHAFWFCNECYRRSCSAAAVASPTSLPCRSYVQIPQDHDSRHRSLSQTRETPSSAMVTSAGELDTPVGQIRQLINEPRFGCKARGCGNYGTASNQGYCNACFHNVAKVK